MARPRQVADEAILTAARACFLEQGPGVSTNVIASAAGVSQATLFKRFGTKEDLLFAALAPRPEHSWLDLANAGPDERPARDQLIELANAITTFFHHLVPSLMCLRSAGFTPMDMLSRFDEPPPLTARRSLMGWIDRASAAGVIAECDADAVATALLGGLQHKVFLAHVIGDDAIALDATTVPRLVDALLAGLKPGGPR